MGHVGKRVRNGKVIYRVRYRAPDGRDWVADLSPRGLAPATVVKAYQLLGRTMTAA